jgi:alpha-1,2-mannosyltransferase
MKQAHFIPCLSERRVRFEAILLGLFVWANLALTLTGRYGFSDLFQFYTQGTIARQRNAGLLYDFAGQTAFSHQLLPGSKDIPCIPVHPPQVSVLFAPFAMMTYSHAQLLWWIITCAGYALCCYGLWIACPNLRPYPVVVALTAATFPGLLFLIKFGQTTVIALAAFTLAFYCLRGNRQFAAGLAIGLLAYKPQLGLVAAGIFLLTRAWPVVAGALITGLGQYAVACWWYRKLIALDFLSLLNRLRYLDTEAYEPKEWAMHSLRPFWRMLLPSSSTLAFSLYLATALLVFLCCLRIWKSPNPLSLRFAAFLLATVLVDPHLYVYDLVLLAPALMLLVDWWLGMQAQQSRVFTTLLYLTYSSSLLVGIAQNNFVSISTVALSVALFGFLYLKGMAKPADACCRPTVLAGTDLEHAPSLPNGLGV